MCMNRPLHVGASFVVLYIVRYKSADLNILGSAQVEYNSTQLGRLAHIFRQVDSDSALVFYNNNQGVIALSKYPVHHNASKHINVRYHFVRDCVISGKTGLKKISTVDNVADGMTKCLSADHF